MIDSGRLRELRTLAGLSQRRLSKLAGIGPVGIKRLEDGGSGARLPLEVVARIAAALGVQITDLLASPGRPADATSRSTRPTRPVMTLNLDQARLLRRIHQGEDVRRRLRREDRELTLPNLVTAGLVDLGGGVPRLSATTSAALAQPTLTRCSQG